jgi:aspartyl-tRNA(Asn)/glutamyl-tRNA(Gln) amidotransferase subunit B
MDRVLSDAPVTPGSPDVVIGLEIHVQLDTGRKLFCADRQVRTEPNSAVCPVCLGLPGALPILDRSAVDLALRVAAALQCDIPARSTFERKSYFYPDLPKGYQITQHEEPLAVGGHLEFRAGEVASVVRIRRVHLEEDAGRLLHDRIANCTAVDFNRAGVPLVEIVTEPELGTAEAARAFLLRLRQTLRHLRVSECDMENGSLRVDANVSVGGYGAAPGARVEIKNLNSFAHVEAALRFEIRRQRTLVREGRAVRAETRSWDPAAGATRLLRTKEQTHDYRYIPEPDLPTLRVSPTQVTSVRESLPELPWEREQRFAAAYDLPPYDIEVLTADPALADYFESVVHAVEDARAAARWVLGPVLAWVNRTGTQIERLPVPPRRLAELIELVSSRRVSRATGRQLFDAMAESGESAGRLVERGGLEQVSDESTIRRWIDVVAARHPQEAARLRAGERKLLSFLMGRVMRESGNRADPSVTARLLEEQLDA